MNCMKFGSSNLFKIICLVLGLLVIGYLFFNSNSSRTSFLPFLLILACPLSMIFMMKGMGHGQKREEVKLYSCKECGLHYREKTWAYKCEEWCKEHHSCNIEITAHAEQKVTS